MRQLFVLLVILFSGIGALASSYGRLRITVQQRNAEHHWNVSLSANGNSLTRFSHALSGSQIVELSRSHLNSSHSRTEISASYREFHDGETCKFQYLLEFSMDGSGWTQIGYFSAPNSGDRTTIPVGLCDSEVCSSDGRLQGRIEQQRLELRKQEIRLARTNLENSSRRLADLKRSLEAKAREFGPQRGPREFSTQNATAESELLKRKQQAALDKLKRQVDGPQGGEENLDPQKIAEQLLTETNRDLAEEQVADLNDMLPKEARELGEALQDPSTLAELSAEEQRHRKVLQSIEPENLGDLLSDISAAKVGRYLLTHPELFKEALMMGIRFTPAGDLIDACETITGAENCMPGVRELGTGERILSALGVLAGNRVLWSKMGNIVSRGIDEIKTLIKDADGLADSVVAKSILRNQSEVEFKIIDRVGL